MLKANILQKRSPKGIRGFRWQKRMFRLYSDKIVYSAIETDMPLGEIPLICITKITVRPNNKKMRFNLVMGSFRTFELQAGTEQMVDEWVDILARILRTFDNSERQKMLKLQRDKFWKLDTTDNNNDNSNNDNNQVGLSPSIQSMPSPHDPKFGNPNSNSNSNTNNGKNRGSQSRSNTMTSPRGNQGKFRNMIGNVIQKTKSKRNTADNSNTNSNNNNNNNSSNNNINNNNSNNSNNNNNNNSNLNSGGNTHLSFDSPRGNDIDDEKNANNYRGSVDTNMLGSNYNNNNNNQIIRTNTAPSSNNNSNINKISPTPLQRGKSSKLDPRYTGTTVNSTTYDGISHDIIEPSYTHTNTHSKIGLKNLRNPPSMDISQYSNGNGSNNFSVNINNQSIQQTNNQKQYNSNNVSVVSSGNVNLNSINHDNGGKRSKKRASGRSQRKDRGDVRYRGRGRLSIMEHVLPSDVSEYKIEEEFVTMPQSSKKRKHTKSSKSKRHRSAASSREASVGHDIDETIPPFGKVAIVSTEVSDAPYLLQVINKSHHDYPLVQLFFLFC